MADHPDHSGGAHGATRWVAVVDDDGSVRTALARVLRAEGIRADTYGTAHEYLAASTANGAPSCLVLDVHLGAASRMSGLELHDYLASHGAGVPIILMTAYDDVSSTELARRVGPDGFLRKPFDSDALLALVRRHLGAPSRSEAGGSAAST